MLCPPTQAQTSHSYAQTHDSQQHRHVQSGRVGRLLEQAQSGQRQLREVQAARQLEHLAETKRPAQAGHLHCAAAHKLFLLAQLVGRQACKQTSYRVQNAGEAGRGEQPLQRE